MLTGCPPSTLIIIATSRIAAQQLVFAEQPQVAASRHRLRRPLHIIFGGIDDEVLELLAPLYLGDIGGIEAGLLFGAIIEQG